MTLYIPGFGEPHRERVRIGFSAEVVRLFMRRPPVTLPVRRHFNAPITIPKLSRK